MTNNVWLVTHSNLHGLRKILHFPNIPRVRPECILQPTPHAVQNPIPRLPARHRHGMLTAMFLDKDLVLKARAVASPIPAPDAVQKAVFPARRMVFSLVSLCLAVKRMQRAGARAN